MRKIEESLRIKDIEDKFGASIGDIFYAWHWKEGFTHNDIANKVAIPRPTITRWFKQFRIPSQDCERFTKKRCQIHLLKVLKKIKKKKFPYEKPCLANKHFFKTWSRDMAYVLGYFAADGSMYRNPRGAYFIDFVSIDKELIENIKRMFDSRHRISESSSANCLNNKRRYHLQIGSKEMFKDIVGIGLTPRKSKIIKLPIIPKEYFADFVRGNFDGDGCVKFAFYKRKGRKKQTVVFCTRFSSGSKIFLEQLLKTLQKNASILGGSVLTKKDKKGDNYELQLSTNDSFRLYDFMYKNVKKGNFLRRKFNIFQEAKNYYGK